MTIEYLAFLINDIYGLGLTADSASREGDKREIDSTIKEIADCLKEE